MKSLILALIAAFSFSAQATTVQEVTATISAKMFEQNIDIQAAAMNWAIGDTAAYALDVGGFIKGTMTVTVKNLTATELTLTQDADLGQMGKQSCESVIDSSTGKVKSTVCDGKPQEQQDDQIKVDDMKHESVTVPAGTFDTEHIKAHMVKSGSTVEQWINPKLIPVLGMAKAIMQSQLGPVNLALASFRKN